MKNIWKYTNKNRYESLESQALGRLKVFNALQIYGIVPGFARRNAARVRCRGIQTTKEIYIILIIEKPWKKINKKTSDQKIKYLITNWDDE